MKSVFNNIEKEKPKEIVFPVLAEALVGDETFVVLLFSNNKGVVVKGNSYNPVGTTSDLYDLSLTPSKWRTLSSEESIVLSND